VPCYPLMMQGNVCPLDARNRPSPPEEFLKYLPYFMATDCSQECPFCGESYLSDVLWDGGNATGITSRYRFFHTVLSTQEDFVGALREAYALSDRIEAENPGLSVYPYSIFYVFFAQYLTIVRTTALVIILALASVTVLTAVLLGSVSLALVVAATVLMIQIDLMGCMYLWGVSLNAVSATNICVSIGISVEFCVHIARAFSVASGSRVRRARRALGSMGASVFTGIATTKFLGVIVLAFSPSLIFVIYFFRIYLLIVVLATLHGLMFLPVALSYVGAVHEPMPWEEDEDAREKLAAVEPEDEEPRAW
jgi:Niemann-Pick C1 protein